MKNIHNPLFWFLFLLIPIFLIITSTRLLVNPLYPEIEYRMPGFPADKFGFTFEERLHWSRYAVDYLLNSADISYLADLDFENGNALFNDRELSHMVDVKVLVQAVFKTWYAMLAFIFLLGVWSFKTGRQASFWHAVYQGGWLTIGLIFAILIGTVLSFQELFTGFHRIFFQGDTWLFYYSDTLIRLFPLRFWQDAFILMGLFTISGAVLLIFLGKRKS